MVLRRLRRRPQVAFELHPDDLPKRGLFAEPIRVTRLEALEPEAGADGGHRVTFLVEIKDAEDRRCPDVAVEARVSGPERQATVFGTTDLMGRIRFRMTGPVGTYAIELTDVGAGGLAWDPDAGGRASSTTVAAR